VLALVYYIVMVFPGFTLIFSVSLLAERLAGKSVFDDPFSVEWTLNLHSVNP